MKRVRRRLAAALDLRATGIDPRLGVNCIVESIMDAEQIEAEIVALGRRSTPVQIVSCPATKTPKIVHPPL
jgi:hypothetical protein